MVGASDTKKTYNDACIRVEVIVVTRTSDLFDIYIHTAVVGPVVSPRGTSDYVCQRKSSRTYKATIRRRPFAFAAATTLSIHELTMNGSCSKYRGKYQPKLIRPEVPVLIVGVEPLQLW